MRGMSAACLFAILSTVVPGALADPLDITDTSGQLEADVRARDEAMDRILGAPTEDPLVVAMQGGTSPLPGWKDGVWVLVEPKLHLSIGDGVPDLNGGEEEPGGLTPQLSVMGLVVAGPFEIRATPWIRTGFANAAGRAVDGRVDVKDLWAGMRLGGLSVGFGREDRWFGPSRHGSLTLSDNAIPPWMGGVSGEGRLPWVLSKLGRLRGELDVGWLGQPRGDVANPGLMVGDLRWLPIPELEIGVTRMTIFGGEGRPPVDVGQLLLPTEPHIYDDPDQLLPDQDELAALDFRILLPLQRWIAGSPIRHVEGYWQYGGEDVIGRKLGPIPYPSLAGVANIYGGEITAGPVSANVEYSRLMDDTFRWYVGHRVYHEGFTQDQRSLGNPGGTDSETIWGRLGWQSSLQRGSPEQDLRVALWADSTRRVGVIESRNDKVFTLATTERRWRLGVEASVPEPGRSGRAGSTSPPRLGRLSGGYTLQHLSGEDFVPGADRFAHRVWFTYSVDLATGRPFRVNPSAL